MSKKPSEICHETNVQNCLECDDLLCGDNLIPHKAVSSFGDISCIRFLVTGDNEQFMDWLFETGADIFDNRNDTYKVRMYFDTGASFYPLILKAKQTAEKHDVTVQFLCTFGADTTKSKHLEIDIDEKNKASVDVSPMIEKYPVLHLASHGKKWGEDV